MILNETNPQMKVTAKINATKTIRWILRECGWSARQIAGILRRGRLGPNRRAPRSVKGLERGSRLVSDDA